MQDSASPASSHEPAPSPSGAPPPRPRARRRARWIVALWGIALLVGLRIALPIALGPWIETRLSRILAARVDVGDVSFAPIDAVLTLRNVTVHANETTAGGAPGAGAADDATEIEAARVRLDVQWLPLLQRTLLVRELAIEEGRVDVTRLAAASGGAAPGVERLRQIDPARELPPGWNFALDHVVLRDTRLRLPALEDGDLAPIEVGLRDAQVSIAPRRASAFGRAPNLRVDAVVEGGRLRIDGTSDLRDQGVVVDALIRLKDVSLARLQPYLASLGWAAVGGRLSGHLRYQRDPGRRDLLSGRLEARRIEIAVPEHPVPALAVRRTVAEIDAIDLEHRRIAIASLMLHGARLAVRPDLGSSLPILDGISFVPPPPPARVRRAAGEVAPAPPWTWTIGRAATPFARLRVAGADGDALLSASLSGESLGSGAYWAPVRAWVGRGSGVVVFDGTARMTRGLLIDGRLTASDLDVPAIARALGVPFADLAQAGRAAADLTIEIEPAAAKEPPLDARGQITLADLWLAGPEGQEIALGAGAIELALAGVDLARGVDGPAAPTRVRFSSATVWSPYALFTRAPEGWVLPPFLPVTPEPSPGSEGDLAAPPLDPLARSVAAAPAPAPGVAEAAAAPPARTEVIVATARSRGGRVIVVDRIAEPVRTVDATLHEGWVNDLQLPAASVGSFVAQASDWTFGALQVGGSSIAGRREVDLSAQGVSLAAASPYLEQAGLPLRFAGGTGAFLSQIVFSDAGWRADTTLTLRDARVAGDEPLLRQALGMPPESALAALRDAEGDVTIRVPLASSYGAAPPPALLEVVAASVREAIGRAREAPVPSASIQIVFAPGGTSFDGQATRELASIAEILTSRPDAVVELSAGLSSADRRWIGEQQLLADLDEPGGILGVLRAFGVRDQRERIREALEERGEGRPGRLDADDETVVVRLIGEGPPIGDERLAALASARLARVASALADQEIARPRIRVVDPTGRASNAPPAVRARIAVERRPASLPFAGLEGP